MNHSDAAVPKIIGFEPLVQAKEGEQVILRVDFTGIPTPTITWSSKGIKMEGDYATELGTDGSLIFVCVEAKHAGKYGSYVCVCIFIVTHCCYQYTLDCGY